MGDFLREKVSNGVYACVLSIIAGLWVVGCAQDSESIQTPTATLSTQAQGTKVKQNKPISDFQRNPSNTPSTPNTAKSSSIPQSESTNPQLDSLAQDTQSSEDSKASQTPTQMPYSQQELESITGEHSQEEVIENGQIFKALITYKPGTKIKHGKEVLYYPNNAIAQNTFYVDGQKEGIVQIFTQKGVLIYEAIYLNDKLHGLCRMFDVRSGKLRSEMNFAHGVQDGVMNIYSTDGKLWHQLYYKAGKKEGMAKEFDKNGKVILERFYKNGNEILQY